MLRDADKTKKEIIEWIQQYFEKKAPDCSAIIGISGGKDSSVAAALCAEAIGAERLIGVLMPNGKQEDILYARELTDYLNIPSMELNIGDTVEILGKTLEKNFELCKISGQKALTKETSINLPARVRMTVLYAVAQMMPQGARVVNTSNRSEDFVGYATKYGDSAGDFSPLSGILVHEVKQLGKALGLPEKFVEKTPSDGLSGMSDEEKLGFTYDALDRYIVSGICKSHDIKKKIDGLHEKNLHKIKPMPGFILKDEDRCQEA